MDARYRIAELATMLERRYNEHPIQPDVFGDYETLQGWSYLNETYPIVEMALKLLSDQVGTRSHDISELFRQFSERSPAKAHKVEQAVWEYVTFYNVDVNEHPEFSSTKSFLEYIGEGREYVNWRYWPLENGELKSIWPGLFVEIVASLGTVLLDNEPYGMSKRIMFHIEEAVTNPKRWVDTLERFDVDGRTLLLELEDWQHSHGGLREAFESYVERGLDLRWSKALEDVLYGAYREMSAVERTEVRQLMARLTGNGRTGPRKLDFRGERKLRPELSVPIPRLVKIEARDPHMLWVEFDDGTNGLVDMTPEDGRIPSAWQTPEGWADVRIKQDVPVWSGWYDACPYGMWRQLTGQNR